MTRLVVEGDSSVYYEHHAGGHADSGLTVVLVHGWGVESRCWDGTYPHLIAAGHGVVLIDHRCCGRSERDFHDRSVAAIGADVAQIVEQLDLSRVVLNGWSLGGAAVVEAAARLGDRLAGLVLTCAATPRYTQADGFPHGGTVADVEGTLAALRADRVATFVGVTRAAFADDPGPETLDFLYRQFLATSPRAYATLRDLADVDQRAVLPTLDVPALVYAGTRDQFVAPEIAAAAAELLPQARLLTYDCGHTPFLEVAERYHADVLGFLEGL
jgi:non-heme chloroperoxidase